MPTFSCRGRFIRSFFFVLLLVSWAYAADEPAKVVHELKGHTETIYAVAFSPDGKILATGSFDKSARLWDVAGGNEIKKFAGPAGHQDLVLCVGFSPNGKTLATGSQDKTAKVWDIPTDKHLRAFAHADAVNALALSPDGKVLAGAGKDGLVKLWNPADGKALATLTGHAGPVLGVAFAANGQTIASCGSDQTLRFWNVADGKPIAALYAHPGAATAVAFHPTAATVYTSGEDGVVRFWKIPVDPSRVLPEHGAAVTAVALSADGSLVASASADKSVRIDNFASGQTVRAYPAAPTGSVDALALSANGTWVAGGTVDQRLFLWNAADGKILSQNVVHDGPVTGVAFHPQNTQVLTGGGDGLLKLWAVPPLAEQSLAHPDGVLAAALSPDGKRLITGSGDKIVRSWDLAKPQMERQYTGHAGSVTAVALGSNGQLLASGGADETIRLWNQSNGQQTDVLGGHAGAVTALSFHPGGQPLLSAGADGTVKVWRLPLVAPKTLVHPEPVTSAVLSPDGAKLLTGCGDKQARLWNLASGQQERALPGNTLAVTSVAYSSNGTHLAAGGADKSVTVWSAADGKEIKKFANLPAAVQCIAFRPDGAVVAAGLADNSIRLLDVAQGKEIKALTGHEGPVTALLFTPKGDILSASADKTVQLWSADGVSKAKLAHPAAVHALALSKDGTKLAAGGADKTVHLWSLTDNKKTGSVATPAEIQGLGFNADGSRLVVGGADNRARIYTSDGKLLELFSHEGPIAAVAFHPDGKQIISASADKSARISTSALAFQVVHAGPVRQALFSPKGDQILSAGDDKMLKVWNAADGKELSSVPAHDGAATGLGISSDGTKIVTAGADKTVKVWPLASLQPGAKPAPAATMALTGPAQSVAVSPNGLRVACADPKTNLIRTFDAATGRELMSLPGHGGPIHALIFQNDNRGLISASADKTARLSDVSVIGAWEAHPGGVAGVVFHSNGVQALSGGADKTVKLWDLTPGKPPAATRTFGPLPDPVRAVAYNRDYTQAGAASGKTVKVWNLADGKEVLTLNHPADVLSLSFSVDKTKIVTGAADHLARIWDVASGKELQSFRHAGPVNGVAFHTNNTSIVAGSADKTTAVHNLSVTRALPVATGPVRSLVLIPAGTHFLTGDDKAVKLWNATSGANERTFGDGSGDGAPHIALSKNAALLAAGGADKNVRIYNFADGKLVNTFKTTAPIRALAFSPNNQVLAAGLDDKSLAAWTVPFTPGQPVSPEFGKPLQTYNHDAAVSGVVFDPDSVHYYSGSLDKTVRAWKLIADAPIRNFVHPNMVHAVAFNPAGTHLASACHDGILRIWDLATSQPRVVNAHTMPVPAPIYCLAWTEDGKQIVTGSLDHSVKLWDAAAGTMVREFKGYHEKDFAKGHREGIFSVALSPDGKFLATGGSDRAVKLWNTADGAVVRDLVNPNVKQTSSSAGHPGWVYSLRYLPTGKQLVSAGNAPNRQGFLAVWDVADGKLLAGESLSLGPIYSLAVAPDGKLLAVGCGPHGRRASEVNGYILQMPGK